MCIAFGKPRDRYGAIEKYIEPVPNAGENRKELNGCGNMFEGKELIILSNLKCSVGYCI
jgi:hypothetical protein